MTSNPTKTSPRPPLACNGMRNLTRKGSRFSLGAQLLLSCNVLGLNFTEAENFVLDSLHFDHNLQDATIRDIDIPFCRSSVEQPFCPKKKVDSFSTPKQKLAIEEFSLSNDRHNNLHDLLGDDELFYGRRDRNKPIWNDQCIEKCNYVSCGELRKLIESASGILADKILDEGGFHLSDKNWMDPMYTSTDLLNSMDCRKKHFTFEGWDHQEKRTTMRKAGRLESIESAAPNFKYQKSENVSNFTLPDMTWHSSIGNHDFKDLKDELGESCFITEDARESVSLPSEESCSSTAVRGELERTLLNLKDKHAMRGIDDICHPASVCREKNISSRERNCNKWNMPFKGHINGPGKFTRMSNPFRSIQGPQLHTTSKKRLKPDCSRYFEAEYDLREQSSGCNSFSETSGTTKHVSSGCRHWTEDQFRTTGDTKLESSRSCFERFRKSSAKCSPCCNFTSETHDFCQPNLQNVSGSSIQNIFQVSDRGKFQPQRDEFSGSKSLSSENGKSSDAPDSEVKYRDCKEPTCETPNMGESENKTNCFQQAEDVPSLENSNTFDGKHCNADRKCQFARTSLLCKTGFGDVEVEDPWAKQRSMESDVQSTADSTCEVMTFDIYVQ